jgi:type I restriction enzyme S subunit
MRYTIGQLAEIIDGDRGKNYPKQDEFYPQGYCLFLNTGNVTKEGLIFEENQFITKEKDEALRKGKLKRGDIVYTTRGTVGNAGYYNSNVPYENVRINSGMVILRANGEIVDARFLYQILKSEYYRPYFKQYCTGSAQPQLPIKNFSQIYLNVPDIKTQHRIADILSAYDDLIENNQKQIKLLEEAAQRLYKEWFVDLRFPGHENTKIVDGVPEGWQYEKLGDLVKTTSGGTPSRRKSEYYVNGNIRWIKTKELNDRFIFETEEHITEDAVKNSSAKVLPEGALIVAMYGATIGKIGITAAEMACNQACCAFISFDDMISKEYLYCWLMDNREYLVSQGKGAAQSNLSQEMIRNFSLLCPDKKVIKNFTEIVTTMLENKRVLENKILMLSKARDDLLPKLMSGEVEV